jgi:nucleotide-binding universal stress UspA family protein
MLEAKAQMAQLQQRQRGATRLKSEALLREGDIASTLLPLVSEHNVDLVVAATRGHRHLNLKSRSSRYNREFHTLDSTAPALAFESLRKSSEL